MTEPLNSPPTDRPCSSRTPTRASAAQRPHDGPGELGAELKSASARLARREAGAVATPDRPRYVAGALGPTTRTASISPDVNDPGFRAVKFRQLVEASAGHVGGLGTVPETYVERMIGFFDAALRS